MWISSRRNWHNLSRAALVIALASTSWVSASTFTDAYHAALNNDPQLRAEQARLEAEREQIPIARSRLLPSVSLSGGYSYEWVQDLNDEVEEHYWGVSIEQPLFNWPSWKNYQAAKEGETAAYLRLSQQEREVILRVTSYYLDLLFSARQEYLYQQQLENLELQIEQAGREQSLGVGDRITVLQLRAQQDLTRTDILEARSKYADAQTRLFNMTGQMLDIPDDWRLAEHQPQALALVGTEQDWLQRSVNNLAYLEEQARLRQAEVNRAARQGERFPSVNLSVNYIDRQSDNPLRERESYRLGIDFSVPLYQGGRLTAGVRQADAQIAATRAESERVLAQAQQGVRQTYNRVVSLSERMDALRASEASTRNFLEAANRGLELQLSSKLDVLDARNQLLNIQLRYTETLQAYLMADLELHYSVGALSERRLAEYDTLFEEAAMRLMR